jgi:hypothetical protein
MKTHKRTKKEKDQTVRIAKDLTRRFLFQAISKVHSIDKSKWIPRSNAKKCFAYDQDITVKVKMCVNRDIVILKIF